MLLYLNTIISNYNLRILIILLLIMNLIYSGYMDPPEPPRHLWLEIDYSKINFNDMNHIKMIYTYIPETYNTLNIIAGNPKVNMDIVIIAKILTTNEFDCNCIRFLIDSVVKGKNESSTNLSNFLL